jgi:hypothetical protein
MYYLDDFRNYFRFKSGLFGVARRASFSFCGAEDEPPSLNSAVMSEFVELPQSLEDIGAYVRAPDAEEKPAGAPAPKSSEELLVEMLLSIEGDSISLDAFQFLFELVRVVLAYA